MLSKKLVQDKINEMPEEFTLDDLVNKLIFIEKVQQGLRDSERNLGISQELMEEEIKKWFN